MYLYYPFHLPILNDLQHLLQGYNIHIDGFFHCTARYKQLLSLHEQLQAQNPYFKLPQFPPKKLFLTSSQLEERRVLLEKYIQLGKYIE